MLGLAAAFSPGTIGAAFTGSKSGKGDTMTQAAATQELAAGVRPFQVSYPESDLADLRKRVPVASTSGCLRSCCFQ